MEKKILIAVSILVIVASMFLFGWAYMTANATRCGDATCNGTETESTCPIDCGSSTDSPSSLPTNPDTGIEPTMPW